MSITTNFQLIILPSAECSERHKPLVEREESKHEEEVENMKISCDNSFESQFFSSFFTATRKASSCTECSNRRERDDELRSNTAEKY